MARALNEEVIDLDFVRALLEGWISPSLGLIDAVTGVRRNPYSSRMGSAIADVRIATGAELALLLKFGASAERNRAGAPWGSAYEALVYRGPLARISSYDSPYVGGLTRGTDTFLVVRWINGAMRVNKHPDPDALARAAAWLGCFQREAAKECLSAESRDLTRYADEVVSAWVELALANLEGDAAARTGLERSYRRAAAEVGQLLADRPTLVHGDFYPSNVLVDDTRVIPVDWEWAGVAAGELDLASLIDGWGSPVASRCLDAYLDARWPDHDGGDVVRRLWAARFYLSVRSLGRRSRQPSDGLAEAYLRHVDLALERLEARGKDLDKGFDL